MRYRVLFGVYFFVLVVLVVVPLDGLEVSLADVFVLELRLDYLLHLLVFMPLMVLWRLGFPRHSVWVIMGTGLLLAVGLEWIQYLLPYRSWNVNDAVANMAGVGLGCLVLGIRSWVLYPMGRHNNLN
jgi:glycopeptide antibiotics resistance protein